MPRLIRALSALLTVLIIGFALGACGSDDKSSSSSSGSSGSSGGGTLIKKDPANAGKSFTVGSKNFAEQYILGEIYAQALEAAGFKVKKQLNLGSEQIAFKALKNNQINGYPEYMGTALTSFYNVKTNDVPTERLAEYDLLKKDLARDDITAFPPTTWENTFKVAATKATDAKYGHPKNLSELAAKAGKKASISGFPECRQRSDCLLGLHKVYNWYPKFVSSQGKYDDLDQKQSDFTFGFSTDGELATGKYVIYEDDKHLYPPYYVSFMVNAKGMKALGQSGQDVLKAVQKPLSQKVIQELNSRVTLDKEKPEQAAREYLKQFGFVK